ncbi:hypothetical protein THUN1379_11230 [Paludibacterium sp. THUN1379]|uniref:tetratricopeptide repeat protein n=1 Tax=Paludibacterium sp. THUN1379 TaxID=3112107 RepID=UPI003087A75F|nr:hypothetical protein THUN1379_11230 [Paludibacterium sp. THUN1379]
MSSDSEWWDAIVVAHRQGDLPRAQHLLDQGGRDGRHHPLALPLARCLAAQTRCDDDLLLLLRGGQAVLALPHALAQTRRTPQDAAVWKLAALVQRACGLLLQAQDSLQQALQLAAQDAELHFNLANLLRERGEHAGAEQAFRQALALDGGHVPCLNNLALLLDDLGRGDEAEHCLRLALQRQPAWPALHNNLGEHLARHGKFQAALRCHLQAISLQPDLAWSHECAARVCRQTGQSDQALQFARQACRLAPQAPDPALLLVELLCDGGKLAEALSHCESALQHHPAHADLLARQGDILLRQSLPDEAERAWRQALAQCPEHPQACHGIGRVLAARGESAAALAWMALALQHGPASPGLYRDLGNLCFVLGRLQDAEHYLRQGMQLAPRHADLPASLGYVLREQAKYAAAATSFRHALQLDPGHVEACCNLACLLLDTGQEDEGRGWMDRALRMAPAHPGVLINALQYLPYRADDVRFAALDEVYLQRESLPLPLRMGLSFAMGRVLAQRGDDAAAFAAFAEGNALRRRLQPWDEAEAEARVARILSLTPAETLQAYARLARALPAASGDERVPIFIVGMPRSGTSLIEQILVSQGEVFGAGEQSLLAPLAEQALTILASQPVSAGSLAALRALGRQYLDQLWQLAPDARYISDKMPGNVYWLGLMQLMLPQARFIHAVRDLRDVCLSCYCIPFHTGHGYSDDLLSLGHEALRYRRVVRHWQQLLPPGCVHEVVYESLVADLSGTVSALLQYLGLAWNDQCLAFHRTVHTVRTASSAQVRQPLYAASVGRWQRYRRELAPLLALLAQDDTREATP